jgi:hypothetical protein
MANVVGQNPVKYSYTRFRVFQPSSGGESGVFDDFGVGGVFKYSSIEILQSIWSYTQKPNGPKNVESLVVGVEVLVEGNFQEAILRVDARRTLKK